MNLNVISKPIVVFLGPSCSYSLAQLALDADYRPPARKGDITQIAEEGAQTIVLVDGFLVYDYPPSPMEVYEAIDKGITVIGTSSLGALRAVELNQHGMFGNGWVYEGYLNRLIDSDDEVVASLDSRTNQGQTIPLVRVRFAVSQLIINGKLSTTQGNTLIKLLQNVYFENRTTDVVLQCAKQCLMSSDVVACLLSRKFDIKTLDTLNCLRRIAHVLAKR